MKKKFGTLLIAHIVIVSVYCAYVWSASAPQYVQYRGTIVFYGNAPYSIPVFLTPYGSFKIEGRFKKQLSNSKYQQRTLILIGKVSTQLSKELPNIPIFIVEHIVDDSL